MEKKTVIQLIKQISHIIKKLQKITKTHTQKKNTKMKMEDVKKKVLN